MDCIKYILIEDGEPVGTTPAVDASEDLSMSFINSSVELPQLERLVMAYTGKSVGNDDIITIDVRTERDQIARERRALDEREKWLNMVVERHRAKPSGGLIQPRPVTRKLPKGLTEAVQASITHLGDVEFTVRDVEAHLNTYGFSLPEKEPRSRISMVLKKLCKRGLTEVKHEGSGRDPNRYKAVKK